MSDAIPGVTACTECGGDLATVDLHGERPVQGCTRGCTECDYETRVGVLWYPDRYVVVGVAADRSECDSTDCSSTCSVVTIDVSTQVPQWTCPEDMTPPIGAALQASSE